jgi:hypothetical protein
MRILDLFRTKPKDPTAHAEDLAVPAENKTGDQAPNAAAAARAEQTAWQSSPTEITTRIKPQ